MFSMEWFHLDGQNAFVTGAGSGIGQDRAIGLAQTSRVSICRQAPVCPTRSIPFKNWHAPRYA